MNTEIIDKDYLKKINSLQNIEKYFGDWVKELKDLNNIFKEAVPYEHIIIPDFLNEDFAEKIYNEFPIDYQNWYIYNNPLEVKYANDKINDFPINLKNLYYILSTDKCIEYISKLSDIKNLEFDPYLHGAGIHAHPRNGKLNMHLDYEKHPKSGKLRRLNIILYMSKNWNKEWNGQTELWDENMTECKAKSNVVFNTTLIFKTNDISWHGLPEEIKCPEGIFRKSIAYYYVSDFNYEKKKYRNKATYTTRPQDPYDPKIEKLCKIRSERRLTLEDLN